MSYHSYLNKLIGGGVKSEYNDLEKLHKQNCIEEASLLKQKGVKMTQLQGYQVLEMPVDTKLYKGLLSYVTPSMEEEFYKNANPNEILWLGNKHRAFEFIYTSDTGMNAYSTHQKIYLLDYFNYKNLEKLFKNCPLSKKDLNKLKLDSGFKMSKEQQVSAIRKIRPQWEDIWTKDTPELLPYTGLNCDDIIPLKNLNIANRIIKNFYFEKNVFQIIIQYLEKIGISGIYRKQHANIYFWDTGIFPEEIMLPSKLFQNNLISRNLQDGADWMNWEYPDNIWEKIKNGFLMPRDLAEKNADYKIIRFFFNNLYVQPKMLKNTPDTMSIMTYNVHYWHSIDSATSEVTVKNISNMVTDYNPDFIVFQEVTAIGNMSAKNVLHKYFPKYPTIYLTANGNKSDVFKIAVLSKYPVDELYYVPLPNPNKINRNAIVFRYNEIIFAGIHLEIGGPFHNIKELSLKKEIIESNQKIRLEQLNFLFRKVNPHYLLGDFNFNFSDKEFTELTKKYNIPKKDYSIPTTPFNTTTDMIFAKKPLKLMPPTIIQCNYSDHLPVLQKIPKYIL